MFKRMDNVGVSDETNLGLPELRERIAAVDREVLDALNRRLELVARVQERKQEAGAPLIDAQREAELLEELTAANRGPLSERAVQSVFAAVLDVMKQEVRGEARPGSPPQAPAAPPVVTRLAVVGTGLVGASVGLAAKRAGVARVTGWDADGATLREAAGAKAVDTAAPSLRDAVAGAELVVVAVPVGALVAADRRGARGGRDGDNGDGRRLDETRARRGGTGPALRAGPSARRRRERGTGPRGGRPLRRRDVVPHAAPPHRVPAGSTRSSAS